MINPKVFKLVSLVIALSIITLIILNYHLHDKYNQLNNDYTILQKEYSKNLKELNDLKDKSEFSVTVSKMYESLKDYP